MSLKALVQTLAVAACVAAKDPYDYVIVGGGTAGLALATRLSQGLPNAKILVLEAGSAAPDELRINVPGLRGSALGSVYDWNFTTVAQPKLENRTVDVNRGKVLGGSSALNYLCYNRAAVAEYDAWGELGSPGWNFDKMITAMVKSENFTGNDGDRHGRSGPIRSTYTRIKPDFLSTWQPTLSKLGVPVNDGGSEGGNPIGVMFQPTNIDVTHWNRSYSANSYLPLAKSNLEVRTNSQVARIEFAPAQPGPAGRAKATGGVLNDGTKIAAAKEVILSSGSIGSPGLLELSGVGAAKVLKAAGIAQVIDLPGVGENYQDHIRLSNTYRLKDSNATTLDTFIYDGQGQQAKEQLQLWIEGKTSWYDFTSVAYSFLDWAHVVDNATQADLLRTARSCAGKGSSVDAKKIEWLASNPSVPQIELIMEPNYVAASAYPGGKFLTLLSTVMHPMSRGSVHIDPASPRGKPIIDPKYMTHPYDVKALIEAAKYSRKVAQTQPMASLWQAEVDPGNAVQTDAQWIDYARKTMLSFFHPVGTCAMLPRNDGGVVDASLVVYGTSNLRVVDNSIMPVLISAHIQTAAYGIAEIAADIIINDSKKP